jgi:metal-responsive CopG/Arc/MetJ family transcriptional regulator
MIAVSLPDELLKRLDDAVDKTGKKRSFDENQYLY